MKWRGHPCFKCFHHHNLNEKRLIWNNFIELNFLSPWGFAAHILFTFLPHFHCKTNSHIEDFLRCTASPATPTVQYVANNRNTYTCRHIQNSLTLSVFHCPLFFTLFPALILTHTHTHKAFAICMYQYEGSTQARKMKAELDYLGSVWHEKARRFGPLAPPCYTQHW